MRLAGAGRPPVDGAIAALVGLAACVGATSIGPGLRSVSPRPPIAVTFDAPGSPSRAQRAALVFMQGGRLAFDAIDADALELIDGIGPSRAARMLDARAHAKLSTAADLERLDGIGPVLATRVARHVHFDPRGHDDP